MKLIAPFILVLATSISLSAQIHKGVVLLGGTFGFSHFDLGESNYSTYNISPEAGFFLNKHVAVGASLEVNFLFGDKPANTSYGFLPFTRLYFGKKGIGRFFGQLDLGIQSLKSGDSPFSNSLVFGLGLGADFFLNQFVAIEGILAYSTSQNFGSANFPTDKKANKTFGLNFGVVTFIDRSKAED